MIFSIARLPVVIVVMWLVTMSESFSFFFFKSPNKTNTTEQCVPPYYANAMECNSTCQEPAFCKPQPNHDSKCYLCNWGRQIEVLGVCGGITYNGRCQYRSAFNHVTDAVSYCKDHMYTGRDYHVRTKRLDFYFRCYYCDRGLFCE